MAMSVQLKVDALRSQLANLVRVHDVKQSTVPDVVVIDAHRTRYSPRQIVLLDCRHAFVLRKREQHRLRPTSALRRRGVKQHAFAGCQFHLYARAPALPKQERQDEREDRQIVLAVVGGEIDRCRHAVLLQQWPRLSMEVDVPIVEGDRDTARWKRSRGQSCDGFAKWKHTIAPEPQPLEA